MCKKHRKKKQKKSFPWALMAWVGVLTPDFMMHEGMDGKHDFAVHLKTNDPHNPDFLVHVLSDWGP